MLDTSNRSTHSNILEDVVHVLKCFARKFCGFLGSNKKFIIKLAQIWLVHIS